MFDPFEASGISREQMGMLTEMADKLKAAALSPIDSLHNLKEAAAATTAELVAARTALETAACRPAAGAVSQLGAVEALGADLAAARNLGADLAAARTALEAAACRPAAEAVSRLGAVKALGTDLAVARDLGADFAAARHLEADLAAGRSVLDNLKEIQCTIDQATALTQSARQPWKDLAEFPRDLSISVRPIVELFESQQGFLEAQGSVYLLSQRYLETFDWTRAVIPLSATSELSRLHDATTAISRSYETLIQAVAAIDPQRLAPIVYDLPPLDVAAHADFLRIWVEADEVQPSGEPDTQSECQLLIGELRNRVGSHLEPRLGMLKDGLPKMWIGARQALRSSNPDRCRHAAVSTRELITHLVHLLAPDDRVRQWTSDPAHYDEKNRPTRRARILYICRRVATEDYASFVERIIGGTLAKLDLLQKGTHQIEASFGERQVEALVLSLGADLLLLIESSNSNH
jgi:hypothetical protein